jgi:hypothetical protein
MKKKNEHEIESRVRTGIERVVELNWFICNQTLPA